jgi:Na+-translocating ferredoxin:NAD+ oxidoreductase subunit B
VPTANRPTTNRLERIEAMSRKSAWKQAPLRIDRAECINCDECIRSCPRGFGAIFRHAGSLVIVPELCSGCGKCLPVCPVDCIHGDSEWRPAPDAWWQYAGSPADTYR